MTSEKFDLIAAIYLFCADYHSGQWSRGYRILSRIETRYRPRNLDLLREEETVKCIYDQLVKNYADKM